MKASPYQLLRASTQSLLDSELRAQDWVKRSGIFTRKIDDQTQLWLSLGMTSYGYPSSPVVNVWPNICIRHLSIESIEKRTRAIANTWPLALLVIGVKHLLEPRHGDWWYWLVTEENQQEQCSDLLWAIATVAPRFAAEHGTLEQLIVDLRGRLTASRGPLSEHYSLPIALFVAGRNDEAVEALELGAKSCRGETYAAAVDFRLFRRRLRKLIRNAEKTKAARPRASEK